MPTDTTRRAALRSGPDLEALPSFEFSLFAGALNLFSLVFHIFLLLTTGGVGNVAWIAVNSFFVWLSWHGRTTTIKRRNEVRERNYETVESFYDRHDVLWLEPSSPELQERDDQWAREYALIMYAQGKLPNGDPLPVESNRSKKRRERQERSEEVQKALGKKLEGNRMANILKQRPSGYAHDYHCDDPAGPCTCSSIAPNCRCNVCDNRSMDPWDERF